MFKILIINGPNINLLGVREPEIYGKQTLQDVEAECRKAGQSHGLEVSAMQSNHEGMIIDAIQQARNDCSGIIINPAALSHSSVGILDALNAFEGRVIEVHISNLHKREAFRHFSYISTRADGIIMGLGVQGYALAVTAMAKLLLKD